MHVGESAVRKARDSGRFKKSLKKDADGKVVGLIYQLAVEEWSRSSRTGKGVRTVGAQGAHQPPQPSEQPRGADPLPTTPERDEIEADDEGQGGGNNLFEAQTRAALELARQRKLANDEREILLVPVQIVERERFEIDRIVREGMLNMAARIAGKIAVEHDPARIVLLLNKEVRETLEATADQLQETGTATG